MEHQFVEWPGFSKKERYCRICDQDESKDSAYSPGMVQESPGRSSETYES